MRKRTCRLLGSALTALLFTGAAWSQVLPGLGSEPPAWPQDGWSGFNDLGFVGSALLTLTLAAVLGAVIGYHPLHRRNADTLEKIEAPKAYTFYAVIGAIIGIMVLRYGLVVGFVIFGIGGLIRFRTDLRAPMLTSEVIFVTLIGLSCGLNLPHVAVLATAFGFVLIYVIDSRITYRIEVKALPEKHFAAAAVAYRRLLEELGCRVLNEKKSPGKQRVILLFRSPRRVTRQDLEEAFESRIDAALRGSVDWEID